MSTMLLTKANLKKNKGSSVALTILLSVVSALICLLSLLMLDFYPTPRKCAERLEAGDSIILITEDTVTYTDSMIEEAMTDNVERYDVTRGVIIPVTFPYNGGELSTNAFIDNESVAFNRHLGKTEIVSEDQSIISNYIYVPYQLHTDAGYKLGDSYTFTGPSGKHTYKIKGFINNILFGDYSYGIYEYVFSDAEYSNLEAQYNDYSSLYITLDYKKGTNISKNNAIIGDKLLSYDPLAFIDSDLIVDDIIFNRIFTVVIILSAFIIAAIILIAVILMMTSNYISNYVKENMKALGALKAIGFTTNNIRLSLVLQFMLYSMISLVFGIVAGYILMPVLGSSMIGRMAIPYHVSFNFASIIITILVVMVIVLTSVFLFTLKLKKLNPILAMREGLEAHNFKKNVISLEKTKLGLNLSMAIKNTLVNIKQHIITFVLTIFLFISATIGFVMFENFNLNVNLEILTAETCDVAVATSAEKCEEVKEYLIDTYDVENIRNIVNCSVIDDKTGYDKIYLSVVDDISRYQNKGICYKGRFPLYDNEIAISGKYVKEHGYKIGSEITISYAGISNSYIITGLTQHTGNDGRCSIMTAEAFKPIFDITLVEHSYYFEYDGDCKALVDDVNDKYGSDILSTIIFDEIAKAQLGVFKSIAAVMLLIVLFTTFPVIALVLYLLIKALVYNNRRKYGIYKAMGFTSNNLMLQNAISFMPSIIIASILGAIISCAIVNPFIGKIMYMFGIMKLNMPIPYYMVIIFTIAYIIFSFGIALLLSRRIKKLEAYDLLMAD